MSVVLHQYVLKSRSGKPVMAFSELASAKSARSKHLRKGVSLCLVRQIMTEEEVYEV